MENSHSCCNTCKHETETQSIAIQTDCTENNDSDVIHFCSPGSCFRGYGLNQMQKLSPCQGDLSHIDCIFDDSDISSIVDEDSLKGSFFDSFIHDDSCLVLSPPQLAPKLKFENSIKKFLSPQNLNRKTFKFLSTTPGFNRFNTEENRLDESYEEMMTSMGGRETNGLKESFIQLIQVEKLSMRMQLKRYSSGKF